MSQRSAVAFRDGEITEKEYATRCARSKACKAKYVPKAKPGTSDDPDPGALVAVEPNYLSRAVKTAAPLDIFPSIPTMSVFSGIRVGGRLSVSQQFEFNAEISADVPLGDTQLSYDLTVYATMRKGAVVCTAHLVPPSSQSVSAFPMGITLLQQNDAPPSAVLLRGAVSARIGIKGYSPTAFGLVIIVPSGTFGARQPIVLSGGASELFPIRAADPSYFRDDMVAARIVVPSTFRQLCSPCVIAFRLQLRFEGILSDFVPADLPADWASSPAGP
jgi:hypothetical protein